MAGIKEVMVGAPATATGAINTFNGTSPVLPTTATAVLAGNTALGYVGEDGLTETQEQSVEKIKAWGGDTVKVLQTEHGLSYSFQFLENSSAVMQEVYGEDNVTTTPATESSGSLTDVAVKAGTLPIKPYVFDMKDGDALIRIVLPQGQIIERGDITYVHSDIIRYQVTIEALPDANGVKAYKYIVHDDQLAGSPA